MVKLSILGENLPISGKQPLLGYKIWGFIRRALLGLLYLLSLINEQ
jgi:hypothetical protein